MYCVATAIIIALWWHRVQNLQGDCHKRELDQAAITGIQHQHQHNPRPLGRWEHNPMIEVDDTVEAIAATLSSQNESHFTPEPLDSFPLRRLLIEPHVPSSSNSLHLFSHTTTVNLHLTSCLQMAERVGNCLIGLIVGRGTAASEAMSPLTDVQLDLRDKHKRWRLDRENSRRLEAQSHNGTRSRPTTAHAAAVHKGSLPSLRSQTGLPPLEFGAACSFVGAGSAPASVDLSSSSPSTKLQILMPNRHYLNVHSHYAKVSVNVELDEANDETNIADMMQSYDYSYLDTYGHIDFKCHRSKAKARTPARKALDLERLPPLSTPMAEEITHMDKVHGQVAIFARLQNEREANAELQRMAKRAPQHEVPSYKMRLGPLYARNGSKSDAPTPPITPAESPSDPGQTNAQSLEGSKACNGPPQERRVRWVPNLMQQQQKLSDILQRRQRPPPVEHRRLSRAKSALRVVTTASMGR